MKRQYIALLILLATLVILSLWTASNTNISNIERQLTNTSNEQHGENEGLIEGGNLLVLLGVTIVLVIIAVGAYLLAVRRK